MKLTDRDVYGLHLELLGAGKAERRRRIAAFAAARHCSPDTVRKRLDAYKSERTRRAGRTNAELQEDVHVIAGYRQTPDGVIAWEAAQTLAAADDRLHRTWPLTTLREAARREGLIPRAAYVRRMEAPHANAVHRVDASGSRHFRLAGDPREPDPLVEVCRAEQRNKRWASAEMIWLLVLIDDYSRVAHADVVATAGESAHVVQTFLLDAWRTHQPRGLPDRLLADNGSFASAATTKALLHHLQVPLSTNAPGHSQANGRVERQIRTIKEGFERVLLARWGEGHRVRLGELRDELQAFIRTTNGRPHPLRRDRSRSADWARSMGGRTLRECPADALYLATWQTQRKVTAEGWVRHEGRAYEVVGLPHGLRGRTLTLLHNRAGELVAQHDGTHYALRPAAPLTLGDYDASAERGRARPTPPPAAPPRPDHRPWSGPAPTATTDAGTPDNVLHLPPRPEPVQPADPFAVGPAAQHTDVAEAIQSMQEVIGAPLHAVASEEQIAKLRWIIEQQYHLERRRCRQLAEQIREQLHHTA